LAFLEFDALALLQLFHRDANQGGVMKEELSAIACDEAKTLFGDQLFDCTLCHLKLLQNKKTTKT